MRQIPILLMLLPALSFFSCKHEKLPDLTLPAATQSGQNTLGFLLDNIVWTNYGRRCTIAGCNNNKVMAHLYRQPNGDLDLEVSAGYTMMSSTTDQLFYFYTTNVTNPGTYYLDSSLGSGAKFIANRYNQFYKEYKSIRENSCELTILKFDTTNKIIAGSFKGVLFNPVSSSDSVIIHDGRFDVQLDYR